jgi:hypothetical protein
MAARALPELFFAFSVGVGVAVAAPALADHALSGGYHWPRAANPVTIPILNNLTDTAPSYWRSEHLPDVVVDWHHSSVIDLAVTPGTNKAKSCRAVTGYIVVCDGAYGKNGVWGSAQYWTRGVHITQAVVRMNDSYFDDEHYFAQFVPLGGGPASEWRRYTLCQEIGHALGLDHNDGNNDTTTVPGTCMDYTWNSGGAQSPNRHDYADLERIYGHLDTSAAAGATGPAPSASAEADPGMGSPARVGPPGAPIAQRALRPIRARPGRRAQAPHLHRAGALSRETNETKLGAR